MPFGYTVSVCPIAEELLNQANRSHNSMNAKMLRRSVLVTGSSGFVGGAVLRRLPEFDLSATGLGRRKIEMAGYVSHDLTHPLPEELGPFDAVVHAAARSSPWGSRRQYEADNVEATCLLLDHCRTHGRPKFVFLSLSSVYYRPAHQLGIPSPTRRLRNRSTVMRPRDPSRTVCPAIPGPVGNPAPAGRFGPGDTVLFPRVLAAAAGRPRRLVSADGPVLGDLIYIDNLVDMIIAAATRDGITGEFNVTNNQPVPIVELLFDLLSRLSIPPPAGQISTRAAMRIAGLLEWAFRLMPWREPPITRFGVHVLAYSKTFNVTKMLATFGPPKVSLEEGVGRFVQWMKRKPRKAADDRFPVDVAGRLGPLYSHLAGQVPAQPAPPFGGRRKRWRRFPRNRLPSSKRSSAEILVWRRCSAGRWRTRRRRCGSAAC